MGKRRHRNRNHGSCPLCDRDYNSKNHPSRHHIFPKYWYGQNGIVSYVYVKSITVEVCSICHRNEFNVMFPMRLEVPWTLSECVQNWVKFCKTKGKNAYDVYPELKDLKPLL